MTSCDVLVVGGGPAGSTCATALVRGGLGVIVLDKATFPRDKVCAGWITPSVVRALDLDVADYGRSRTLQPFTGFQTSTLDGDPIVTEFDRPISYGIRRCEFDTYLLRRSNAVVMDGQPLRALRREDGGWIANEAIRARVVIGAGGHFCPVARWLNPPSREQIVVAQEIESPLAPEDSSVPVRPECPELYFWPDFSGYGWCVRKQGVLNVGAGRLDASLFPAAVDRFKSLLRRRGRVPPDALGDWKGHAYLLNSTSSRRTIDDGILLVGDSAGLALAPSGEGILSAIESGTIAATAVLSARSSPALEWAADYKRRLDDRFGAPAGRLPWPGWIVPLAARLLFRSRWLTRRVLLENAFLHVSRG